MKHFASIAAAALGIAIVPAAAHAQAAPKAGQAAPAPKVGATIYDASGAEVGKIESITNGVAVVFTGTNRASIPLTSFGTSPKGPTLGMTRAQLDEAAAKAQTDAVAALRAKIVPGAEVRGEAGTVIAKVKEATDTEVVLTTEKGDVRVPIGGIGGNAQGLFIGMSQAEFDAAVAASSGSAAQ